MYAVFVTAAIVALARVQRRKTRSTMRFFEILGSFGDDWYEDNSDACCPVGAPPSCTNLYGRG
jgi:hypothetical protein